MRIKISKKIRRRPAHFEMEEGAEPSMKEWEMIVWILENVGGELVVRRVIDKKGMKTSDLIHDGIFAEIKHTNGVLNTLNKRLGKATKQAKGGKVFVDITGAKYSNDEAIIVAISRVMSKELSEIYLIRKEKLVMRIQHKKPPDRGSNEPR